MGFIAIHTNHFNGPFSRFLMKSLLFKRFKGMIKIIFQKNIFSIDKT